jgi:hypothetical protein
LQGRLFAPAGTVAAREFTHRSKKTGMGGSAQLLLFFPSCTGVDNHCHLQKAQNATTSCPLSISVFLYLHPTDPVFWALLSSLFQVAGKEEDTDQRGVAARYSEHNYQVEIVF